ncbi:MAG TPA: hypothetical protein VF339_11530 [Gammaproteobacteria bacterium]
MRRDGLRRAAREIAAVLVFVVSLEPAFAQEPGDDEPFHWGYALAFGTGAYRLTDGTEARTLRISPSIRLRDAAVRRGPNFGVRVVLPFAVGIQNLDDVDLPPERPSDEIEYAAVMPGVEFEFPGERVTLRVRGQAGWGTELESVEASARFYAVGIRSRFAWPDAPGQPALINGLLWAGVVPEEDRRQSLLRLSQGIEFDVAVPRWKFKGRTMHLSPHVLADWYYRPPSELALGDEHFDHVATEWQIGLAARREGRFKILWFRFEGVGVGYRFSQQSEGIRFFLNSIF